MGKLTPGRAAAPQPRNPFRLRGGLLAQSRGRPPPSVCEQVRADGKGLSPRLRRRPLPHGHESGPPARHEKSRKRPSGRTSPSSLFPLSFREGATRRFRVPAKRGFRVLWRGGDARIAGAADGADRACTGMRHRRAVGRQRRPAVTKAFVVRGAAASPVRARAVRRSKSVCQNLKPW